MYPIVFSIGRLHIYTHGIMIILGIVLGSTILYLLAKKKGLETNFLFDTIIYSIFGGLIGARLAYIIFYSNQFANIKEIFFIWYGGLVSFGGFIGGLLVAWLILHFKKKPVAYWFDLAIIGLMVGWAVGRIGCLLSGDSLGIVSSSKIAIWGRVPTQLIESFWSLVVAGGCFWLINRKTRWNLPDGFIFWAGLAGYSLGRFVIDFWRDEQKILWGLRSGQIVSLLIFILAGFIIGVMIKKLFFSPRKEY